MTRVTIEIGNLATDTEAIIGAAGSQVLIGQVVLETLDLIADCSNRTLAPRHPEGPVLALREVLRTVIDIKLPTAPSRSPFSTASRAWHVAR